MDKEVLREIWHGQLPLCFKMHPDDVIGMHRPEPYYMMVPRISYFPIVLDRVIKYFNRFMDQKKLASNDMWLDYDGQPIKWQHPIGLSWDLFGSHYDLPWRLILHFSEFPTTELVRCNTKASIETNFVSSIKEADTLKHKGAVVMNMSKKELNQVWSSLVNNKFDQFWIINEKLMKRTDNELFRYIPFRLYLPDYTYVQKSIRPCTIERHKFSITEKELPSSDRDSQYLSSASIVHEYNTDLSHKLNISHKCSHLSSESSESDGTSRANIEMKHRCTTMLDLIHISFMNRLNDLIISASPSPRDVAVRNFEVKNKDDLSNTDATKGTESSDELIDVKMFKYRFVTHGVEVPFDTPLQWLSEHFSYPDNFLHICAVVKEDINGQH